MMERILAKLTSGKWLLTMATAIVFIYCSITKVLNAEVIGTIISMVFTLYFTRKNGVENAKQN